MVLGGQQPELTVFLELLKRRHLGRNQATAEVRKTPAA